MQLSFDQQKNVKASVYTLIICILLSLIVITITWNQPPPIITPPAPEFMEINLGNSETGQGEIPPLSKESPAPEIGSTKNTKLAAANHADDIATNSTDPNDEPIRTKKANAKMKALPLTPSPKPKAVMGKYAGGNGAGGNNQDSYNNIKDQGIAGGKGDQGVANGSINGKVYSGQAGPFVVKGDRKVTKAYSFNGDVEPATIYADIEVSPSGQGRFIQIVKGSSSNDTKYKKAIVEYLNKIAFNSSDHSSVVTVKFKFELQ